MLSPISTTIVSPRQFRKFPIPDCMHNFLPIQQNLSVQTKLSLTTEYSPNWEEQYDWCICLARSRSFPIIWMFAIESSIGGSSGNFLDHQSVFYFHSEYFNILCKLWWLQNINKFRYKMLEAIRKESVEIEHLFFYFLSNFLLTNVTGLKRNKSLFKS